MSWAGCGTPSLPPRSFLALAVGSGQCLLGGEEEVGGVRILALIAGRSCGLLCAPDKRTGQLISVNCGYGLLPPLRLSQTAD